MMLQLNEMIQNGNEAYFTAHQAGREPHPDVGDYPEGFGCTIDHKGNHTLEELGTAAVYAGLFESPMGNMPLSRGRYAQMVREEWVRNQGQSARVGAVVIHHLETVID